MRAGLFVSSFLLFACGARTPLFVDDAPADAGTPAPTPDAGESPDATTILADCASAGASLIYLVSDGTPPELYSVDPAHAAFVDIGTLDCPLSDVPRAFSIAVDRKGNAFVVASDFGAPAQGELWQVSTTTAHCQKVAPYARGQLGFNVFGMAFATNGSGPEETLYIEGAADLGSVAAFGTLDTTLWQVHYLGANEPPIQRGQLTGTGDGRLFEAYYLTPNDTNPLSVDEVEPATGRFASMSNDAVMFGGSSFSAARWGGVTYLFEGYEGPSSTNVDVFSSSTRASFSIPDGITIAASGVSTCAPH